MANRKFIAMVLMTLVAIGLIYKNVTYYEQINTLQEELQRLKQSNMALARTNKIMANELEVTQTKVMQLNHQNKLLKEQLDESEKFKKKVITRGTNREYTLIATGYTPDYHKAPYFGKTASGKMAKPWHTVAVDPNQFPLGTLFYIEELKKYNGTGLYAATDTGGAIDHGDIDICVPTEEDCFKLIGKRRITVQVVRWGKQK